jgi:outer membrane protein assembly factor BamB
MEMTTRLSLRGVRRFLVSLLVVIVAVGLAPSMASAAPGDWAQLGYGAAHTGYQRDETLLARTTVRDLVTAYRVQVGYVGTPVVVGGIIYVALAGYGGAAGHLVAMAASDGSVLWNRELEVGSGELFTPAIANGIAYITSARNTSLSVGGSLYAFDAASGDQLWRVDGTASTSPVVADGKVFVGGGEEGSPADIVAYNAGSGAVLWTDQAGRYPQPGAPAVSHGRVFVERDDGLYAFDEANGAELWHRAVPGGEGRYAPVVRAGIVLVGEEGVQALDATTGDPRWTYRPVTGVPFATGMLVVADGIVYAHIGAQLVALSLTQGVVRWSRTMDPNPFLIFDSSPAVANGVVYIVGTPKDRNQLLAYGTGGYLKRAIPASGLDPIVSNGTIYLGRDSTLSAFRLRSAAV